MVQNTTEDPVFGPIISTYSRAEAIEDSVLVDVSNTGRQLGVVLPVALTSAAYELVNRTYTSQDPVGRLMDVVLLAAMSLDGNEGELPFTRPFYTYIQNGRKKIAYFKAVLSVEDVGGGEPAVCITIMLPNED